MYLQQQKNNQTVRINVLPFLLMVNVFVCVETGFGYGAKAIPKEVLFGKN